LSRRRFPDAETKCEGEGSFVYYVLFDWWLDLL
jgi:hypothetical protein